MNIRGNLCGREVHLQFYGPEDLLHWQHGGEPVPQNWCQLELPEDEARALLRWLNGSRQVDYQSNLLRVRADAKWLVLNATGSALTIRLGTADLIAAFTRSISGALSLLIGRAASDPTT